VCLLLWIHNIGKKKKKKKKNQAKTSACLVMQRHTETYLGWQDLPHDPCNVLYLIIKVVNFIKRTTLNTKLAQILLLTIKFSVLHSSLLAVKRKYAELTLTTEA
jgi:hypothetical protein